MLSLAKRSRQPELLDDPNAPQVEIWQNMRELKVINHWLQGHAASWAGLKKVLPALPTNELLLWDIGCGGGDTLCYFANRLSRLGIAFRGIGIDSNPDVLSYARKHTPQNLPITYYDTVEDAEHAHGPPNICHCAMVLHHLYDDALHAFIQTITHKPKVGYVINDLHRNVIAYWGIKFLTFFLSKSSYVRHDAPLSVAKGFTAKELRAEIEKVAKIKSFSWYTGFRWIVTG